MKQCSNTISINFNRIHLLFALFLHLMFSVDAGAQTDSLYLFIDSMTFVSEQHTSMLRSSSGGVSKVDVDMLQNLPKIMGNTDPLQFLRLLPGIQTNSECDAGIHIHGCDNAHNDVSLGGVPIYGASHLLGLFSVFNPSHYTEMEFSESSSSNRLGGMVSMSLPDIPDRKLTGDFSIGLMSSQGSLGFKAGKNSYFKVSARRSYLNLLYGRWLKISESEIGYGFGDYNFTYLWKPSACDKVWADFYYGNDHVAFDESSFNMNLAVDWGNLAGGLHWEHSGEDIWHKHAVFYSGHESDIDVVQDESEVCVPSHIRSAGYKGDVKWKGLHAGADITFYETKPQYPHIKGFFNETSSDVERQHGLEASLSAAYEVTLADRLDIEASLKGSVFLNPEVRPQYGVSPEIAVSYDLYRFGKLRGVYGMRNQYIFQTGLSNVGLPLEFWMLSGRYGKPQHSHFAHILYDVSLPDDSYVFSTGVYGKLLTDQIEYNGNILDLLMSEYNLEEKFLKGSGLNYGLKFMIHKQSGNLTGWINYTLGRAVRRFDSPEHTGVYPANHERIHDLNVVAAYELGRWNFSGTFIYASGLPFTAPESFYISSGQVIANYGDHNGSRMRPYIRMDLSVTCSFIRNDRQENGLNLSVYNVLGRRNDIMYRVLADADGFSFAPASIPMRFMPSISYYHKF